MANTVKIIFDGGPCSGNVRNISPDQLKQGSVTCGGTVYVKGGYIKSSDTYYFVPAKPIDKTGTTHVTQAWTRWMHALGRTGPDAHNRIRKATADIRRIAR